MRRVDKEMFRKILIASAMFVARVERDIVGVGGDLDHSVVALGGGSQSPTVEDHPHDWPQYSYVISKMFNPILTSTSILQLPSS